MTPNLPTVAHPWTETNGFYCATHDEFLSSAEIAKEHVSASKPCVIVNATYCH